MMKTELKELLSAEILGGREKYGTFRVFRKRLLDSQADALYLLRTYLFWTQEHSHPVARRRNRLKLERKYGIYVGGNVKIGKGLRLPHPTGIIIGKGVTIGENAVIYQQVTFGGKNMGKSTIDTYPKAADNCVFYAGCKVIGGISIADGTQVAANAVLNKDTDGGVWAGVPAKKIVKE